jgi:lambda family phage tail tape measure protein
MATIENFILRMKVEGEGAVKNISGTINNLKDDIADLSQVGGPLGGTINGIIGKMGPLGLAAGALGTAFVALGGKALQLAGELSDISGATGIAAGTLMNFRQSVVEAGGKAEDFGQIAAKLNQSVQEANSGNEKFQESFRKLGVFVTDANGNIRSTEVILRDIITRFRSGQISSEQYAAAIDILGKNINKLELSKLNAVSDPFKDEQIKQLDKYNEAIDKLTEKVSSGLITAFGKLAIAINEAFDTSKADRLEQEANKRGQTYREKTEGFMNRPLFGKEPEPLSGQSVPIPERLRNMTEKEKAAYKARQDAATAHANEMQRQQNRANSAVQGGGGFGATPEAVVKAREASDKRIRQNQIDAEKAAALEANSERLAAILLFSDQATAIEQKTAAQIKEIQINTQAEIAKARLEVFSQEKLSEQEKIKEFASKEREIRTKAAADIAKANVSMQEQLSREQERIQNVITQSKARVTEEENLNKLFSERNKFLLDNFSATDKERERAQQLFDIEQDRLKVLRQISLIKDLPENERIAREQEINAIYEKRRQQTIAQQEADTALQRNFNAGFEKAYRQYVEDSQNYFEAAGRIFAKVTQGMEDSIVNFAKTGKFEFQSFLNSVLEEILRSQVRQLIGQLFTASSGAASQSLSGIGKLLGFANGGIIPTNGPVVVGERGPELLVGASGSRVIPNGQFGGGSVTYNINAVDAPSFKAMIASDPSFIHAVATQGARSIPGRR